MGGGVIQKFQKKNIEKRWAYIQNITIDINEICSLIKREILSDYLQQQM